MSLFGTIAPRLKSVFVNLLTYTGIASETPAVFRQTGGTPGVNELQISHNGNASVFTNPRALSGFTTAGRHIFNNPILVASGNVNQPAIAYLFNNNATGMFFNGDAIEFVCNTVGVSGITSSGYIISTTTQYLFSSNVGNLLSSPDVGLKRANAPVIATTDGSSGKGWLQNSAGRARNTADVTNATATMANLSDLSIPLIAGRKYTGFLTLFANNSTAGEGLAFDFNGGTATMTSFEAGFSAQPPGVTLGTLTTTSLSTALTATTATTADAVYTIEITMVCNAGGTFILRFSEAIAHVTGTATVRLGSYCWIEDMPN